MKRVVVEVECNERAEDECSENASTEGPRDHVHGSPREAYAARARQGADPAELRLCRCVVTLLFV